MKSYPIIIIGAGPAGLVAAIATARNGSPVIIIEKNGSPGRKLLLTGGGRANLTDPGLPASDAIGAFGREGRFLRQTLNAFDFAGFLDGLGVQTETERSGLRKGCVYVKGGSRRLLDALLAELKKLKVETIFGETLRSAVKIADSRFEMRTDRRERTGQSLIIATGGITYPATGSTGDGYAIAQRFGHTVTRPVPAIAPFRTQPCFAGLAGVSVSDATITAKTGNKRHSSRGGLIFTHHGISGPAVLDLSLELARLFKNTEELAGTNLVIDLCPNKSREELLECFISTAQNNPNRSFVNSRLCESLSSSLLTALAETAGTDASRNLASFKRKEFSRLAELVKALPLKITEAPGLNGSIITQGGVDTKKIDPNTMESRITPGLYFAGEVLAPAAVCGGYNLLMAFATGYAAGTSATQTIS